MQRFKQLAQRLKGIGVDLAMVDDLRLQASCFTGLSENKLELQSEQGEHLAEHLLHYQEALQSQDRGLQYRALCKCLESSQHNASDIDQMLRFETLIEELELSEDRSRGQSAKQDTMKVIERKLTTCCLVYHDDTEQYLSSKYEYLLMAAGLLASIEQYMAILDWGQQELVFSLMAKVDYKLLRSESPPDHTTVRRFYNRWQAATINLAALQWRSNGAYKCDTYSSDATLKTAMIGLTKHREIHKLKSPGGSSFAELAAEQRTESPYMRIFIDEFFSVLADATERKIEVIHSIVDQVQQPIDAGNHVSILTSGNQRDARKLIVLKDAEVGSLPFWQRHDDGSWHISVAWQPRPWRYIGWKLSERLRAKRKEA